MERPHSGGTAYMITVSPVPGKYAWLQWRSPRLAEAVHTKCGWRRTYYLLNLTLLDIIIIKVDYFLIYGKIIYKHN